MRNSKNWGLSNSLFTLAFAGLLLFIYFCISGWLIEWLIKINISPRQQIQILQKKVYALDEKTNYPAEKLDNLEITVFRNSTYSSLTGTLSLNVGKSKKNINFICNFSNSLKNYLETNFPYTDVQFKPKTFLTWKTAVLVILLLGSFGYFYQIYEDTKKLPGYPLGQVIKAKADIQKQIADQKEKEKEKVNKDERVIEEQKLLILKILKLVLIQLEDSKKLWKNVKLTPEQLKKKMPI